MSQTPGGCGGDDEIMRRVATTRQTRPPPPERTTRSARLALRVTRRDAHLRLTSARMALSSRRQNDGDGGRKTHSTVMTGVRQEVRLHDAYAQLGHACQHAEPGRNRAGEVAVATTHVPARNRTRELRMTDAVATATPCGALRRLIRPGRRPPSERPGRTPRSAEDGGGDARLRLATRMIIPPRDPLFSTTGRLGGWRRQNSQSGHAGAGGERGRDCAGQAVVVKVDPARARSSSRRLGS